MLTQKLYRNGNSLAVTIPHQYLAELNLKAGSEVLVEKTADEIKIKSKKTVLASDVDYKFMKMIDEFVTSHEDVLKELANK